MLDFFRSAFKNDIYENLDATEFLAKAKTTLNAVVLDVRTPDEYNSGNMDGAINIDFFNPAFSKRVAMLDKDKTYFVYCRSGNRSSKACKIMHGSGFEKLYNLAGGI